MCVGEIMVFNLIKFMDEYQTIITSIVITSIIIYMLVERWWDRRKNKLNSKERVKNKKE